MKNFILFTLITLTTACAGFKPALDQAVETGDNAIINQQATQADGSNKVDAENVESVTTINEGNLDTTMLLAIILACILSGVLFGILIPQPQIIKRIW